MATHTYIYIYIYMERERERVAAVAYPLLKDFHKVSPQHSEHDALETIRNNFGAQSSEEQSSQAFLFDDHPSACNVRYFYL